MHGSVSPRSASRLKRYRRVCLGSVIVHHSASDLYSRNTKQPHVARWRQCREADGARVGELWRPFHIQHNSCSVELCLWKTAYIQGYPAIASRWFFTVMLNCRSTDAFRGTTRLSLRQSCSPIDRNGDQEGELVKHETTPLSSQRAFFCCIRMQYIASQYCMIVHQRLFVLEE